MNINITTMKEISELIDWIRNHLNKTVNFDISLWAHTCNKRQTVECNLRVDGFLSKTTDTVEELVGLIPSIKRYCELNKELSL